MGRMEQLIRKHVERLDGLSPADAEARDALARSLEGAATKLPKADKAAAPVLMRVAGMLRDDVTPASVQVARAALGGALRFAERRGDPDRQNLLDGIARVLDTCTPEPASTRASGEETLPAGFVGELPPASTLDDAAALLVQLEPTDGAGIESLRRMLRTLADAADETGRALLWEAASMLDVPSDDEQAVTEALAAVGSILEPMMDGADMAKAEGAPQGGEAGMPLPPDMDTDLMREFLAESRDYLRNAEAALLVLESDPEDNESINVVFRAFHTIKGTSAFLGLDRVTNLCHHAESLLSRVRDGAIACTGDTADVALQAVDVLDRLLDGVHGMLEGTEIEQPAGLDELVADLEAAGRGDAVKFRRGSARAEAAPVASVRQPGAAPAEAAGEAGEGSGAEVAGSKEASAGPAAGGKGDRAPAMRVKDSSNAGHGGRFDAEATIRIRTDRLDRLVDMVGELVIAHAMIAQDPNTSSAMHHELARKVGHAGKIVRELQDLSMSLRMVPLKATFAKMQRLVRDLARKSGKQVDLTTEGEETEIDRNMVDVLGDPLVHMIRNAVDHGLEPPEERLAAGKPARGSVRLVAYHAGGNVVVELHDDGRGLSRERIVGKAVERGLIDGADGMTDSEVWNLIFAPGFSTAERVTDVSGRGVGMDVVRRHIESLRGRIEIASHSGQGTTITLRLPLTLAITEGMLVRVGSERYLLPTVNIERNVRPEPEMLSTVAGRGEMILLRGELLPIARLHRLFDVPDAALDPTEALLVVVGVGERRCALQVDELLGQQQVVVKSLGAGLGKVPGVTGGAVLGDGTVGLILDAGELVNLAYGDPDARVRPAA